MSQRKLCLGLSLTALLLGAGLGAPNVSSQTTTSRLGFGVDAGGYDAAVNAGIKPEYAQLWVGSWLLKSGWGGMDTQFDRLRTNGVTPVLQFYYWGADLNPTCFQNGCWSASGSIQKSQHGWATLASQLADHLKSRMQGKRAVIVLETEFNRGAMATSEALDAGLEAKAKFFEATYPASEVAIGFGNWAYSNWGTFDRAVKASHYAGIQGMRASTRDSEAYYLALPKSVLAGAQELQRRFGKPVFLSDFAVSSHWEPQWLATQSKAIRDLMSLRGDFKAAGVVGMVYRGYRDAPTASTREYYGEAERHFGLAWADGRGKPAWSEWRNGVLAERSTSTSSGSCSPRVIEAEAFSYRPIGGLQWDSAASGGKRWNLWVSGYIKHPVSFPSAGSYPVKVRALGAPLDGIAPKMEIRLDNQLVMSTSAASTSRDYAATVTVPGPTTRGLTIHFLNDEKNSRGDRNLLADRIEVGCPTSSGGTTTGRVELENAAYKSTGSWTSDGAASAGARWTMFSNGFVTHPLKIASSGTYEIRVRAQGTLLDDRAPHLEARVGGKPVVYADPGPYGYYEYKGRIWLPAGTKELRIDYTNDAFRPGEDRNLWLDRVDVVKVG